MAFQGVHKDKKADVGVNILEVASVSPVVQGDGDNSCILLSSDKMEGLIYDSIKTKNVAHISHIYTHTHTQALGLFRGDSVMHSTMCIALVNEQTDDNQIRMNGVIRKNLGIEVGDKVSVYNANEVAYGERVHLLPFQDSLKGFTGSLFETYLKPYFQDAYRPVKVGDCYMLQGGSHPVEFQVVDVNVKDKVTACVCIVAPETIISCHGVALQKAMSQMMADLQNEKKEMEMELVELKEQLKSIKLQNINPKNYRQW